MLPNILKANLSLVQFMKKFLTTFVVITALIIIGYMVLITNNKGLTISYHTQTCRTIKYIHERLGLFNLENGSYPSTKEGLQALVSNPDITKYTKHYSLLKRFPTDAWGNAFIYILNSDNTYTLKSYASDEKINGKNLAADLDIHLCKEKYSITHP